MTIPIKTNPNTAPGFVKLARHLKTGLVWVNSHFLIVAIIFLTIVCIWVVINIRRNKHRRLKLSKTAHARNLAGKIGHRIGWKDAEKFITWPRDPYAAGAPIVIRYPTTFTALEREVAFIPEVISSLVGGEWDATHDHAHHRLKYIRRPVAPELPKSVMYRDNPNDPIDMIPFAKNGENKWVWADLTGTTPHILISATTGWGKTALLNLFVAHVAARGGVVDICDPKQIGFETFSGLPMVRISTDIDEMIDTIEKFRGEMEEEYKRIKNGQPTKNVLRILIIDELGSFADMCIDHSQALGNRGTPPVFRSMKRILWQGRAAGFHVISAAQQANIKALFGVSDARDQYALRIVAGPQSKEAWTMLFGKEEKPPTTGSIKGRAVIGIGSEFTAAQLAMVDPKDARRIASRGLDQHVSTSRGLDSQHVSTPDSPVVNVVSVVKEPSDQLPWTLPDEDIATKPTLHLVKDDDEDYARAEPPPCVKRGRPPTEQREPVEMVCGRCGNTWETTAANGASVKCPNCSTARRVPISARSNSNQST
jgi:DNA-directed RNA polymerase subunit RPC12/RpoP